jgi:cardiolipin synthase A/B
MLNLLLSLLFFTPATNAGALPLDRNPAPGAYVNADGGPLLPLLANAHQKIDIEIYTMNDLRVRALLREALQRGVKIRIVKDGNPLGSKCDLFGNGGLSVEGDSSTEALDCKDQQKLVQEVRAAGGIFMPFDKAALCPNGGGADGHGCFEHGKIALVDNLALLSTGNFDGTNLCIEAERPGKCNRDYSLVLDDRLVIDTLTKIFEADVGGARYDVRSLIPASLTGLLTVSPASLKPIVDFIDSARTSIDLEAQYLKDPDMNAALSRAARRGVKVNLTVASACAFGRPSPTEVREIQQVYSGFDGDGISSRMFTSQSDVNGHTGYMHAKVIVVDGARAWVGSVNGSTESLTQNREYGLIFDRADDVQTVLATVRADHANSGDESWQDSLACRNDGKGMPPQIIRQPVKKKPRK